MPTGFIKTVVWLSDGGEGDVAAGVPTAALLDENSDALTDENDAILLDEDG